MKLSKLYVRNFRKLSNVEINFADATFLVGANNSGKSSTLDAIEILTSEKCKLDNSCRSRYIADDGNEEINYHEDVIIEGLFIDVSKEIVQQRGFNASRLKYNEKNDTYSFKYRVRLSSDVRF